MAYRNNPYGPGNHTYSNQTNPVPNTGSIKISDEIPLPNNIENAPGSLDRNHSKHSPSIIDFFKERIALEEIILIGIIIFLLIEGIADEFLILMLVYILVF